LGIEFRPTQLVWVIFVPRPGEAIALQPRLDGVRRSSGIALVTELDLAKEPESPSLVFN
jgi:hypothetical protein